MNAVTGAVAETCTSLPWGDNLECTGTDQSPLHFTGKQRDTESWLDDFGPRYNSSSLGRFMTPDPMGGHSEDPQTLNKYVYVRNNPLGLTDPTGFDSYLQCTPDNNANSNTCRQAVVGKGTDGTPQKPWVKGAMINGQFTPTQIGNDKDGNLVDKTTGTGTYTASVNGSGVQFSNDGGKTFSTGVFDNGTPQTTFQDAGWANGNALTGFQFTLNNSKMEANQAEAGTFNFNGTPDQAGAALLRAGFSYHSVGENAGMYEYRSSGNLFTGANSGHFNLFEISLNPLSSVPRAQGNMHFGEHNPFTLPLGPILHCASDQECR